MRKITGTITRITGENWSGAKLRFELVGNAILGGHFYPTDQQMEVVCNANGYFSVNLVTDDTIPVTYILTGPGILKKIYLTSGPDLTLAELLALPTNVDLVNPLETLLSNHLGGYIHYPAFTTIQQAIDSANPGDIVRMAPNTYHISSTILMRPDVGLDLTGSKLYLDQDVTVFKNAPGAHLNGANVDCSGVTFTHTVLDFDGADQYGLTKATRISNITIQGNWQTDGATGRGIYLHCTQGAQNSFIYGVQFSNISVTYLETGLQLESIAGVGAGFATVNANVFLNMVLSHCVKPVVFTQGAGTNIDGNVLTNVELQHGSGSEKAMHIEGTFNMFNNLMVWDWPGTIIVDFLCNYSGLITSIYRDRINDGGYNNTVIAITR